MEMQQTVIKVTLHGLVVAHLTVVHKVPGSSLTTSSAFFTLQPLWYAVLGTDCCTFMQCLGQLSLPPLWDGKMSIS